jgi:hypothetical protein
MMPTETCALLAFATTNSIAISSTALMKFFIRCVSSSLLTSSHRTYKKNEGHQV